MATLDELKEEYTNFVGQDDDDGFNQFLLEMGFDPVKLKRLDNYTKDRGGQSVEVL